jgi:hypothetical protein
MEELKMIALDELLKSIAVLNEKADQIIDLLERGATVSQNSEPSQHIAQEKE